MLPEKTLTPKSKVTEAMKCERRQHKDLGNFLVFTPRPGNCITGDLKKFGLSGVEIKLWGDILGQID